ncbi:MAG: branched-chain amino acid ABC transporter permease [Lautropia sp.]
MSTPAPPIAAEQRRTAWFVFALVLGLMWIVPFAGGGFLVFLGATVAIQAIAALGLQVMVGLAGQLSLGHAAFLGVGAYACLLLQKNLGVPFVVATLAGALCAGIAGLLMAQLVRLSGIYFKIATFGFGIIAYQIFSNWIEVTGGHTGITNVPDIDLFGFKLSTTTELFVLAMLYLTAVYALILRLTHGRIGRALKALGQNEDAARSIGIPVTAYKMAVIVIGSAVAGLAGSLIPHLYRFLNPESFGWLESLVLLIMITVGGLGSVPGAVIGAALLVIIPEYLRDFAEYKMLVYGILLIVCLVTLPRGVAGAIASIYGRWRAGMSKPGREH